MSFISTEIKSGKVAGLALGAGVAYAYVGTDLLSLGIGAGAGYLLLPMIQKRIVAAALPVIPADKRDYVVPAVLGGAIGYGLYNGDLMFTAAGAAAGAALEYVTDSY